MENKIEEFNKRLVTFYDDSSLVIDGIINLEFYEKADLKILWILKEPYGEGGFSYPEYINRFQFGNSFPTSGPMWHKITYINYGILNGFKNWNDFSTLKENESIFQALKACALINLKKTTGGTISNWSDINKHYSKAKDIIYEQIDIINPSIIICGNTFQFIRNDFKSQFFDVEDDFGHITKEGRLFINADHPSSMVNQEKYCDDIINISRVFANR